MILYFTGTGNSKFAAVTIAEKDEQLIDIGEMYREGNFAFEVPDGERLGFVFPVYYAGLPLPVKALFDNWALKGTPGFIFSVITCGSTPFASSEKLEMRIQEKGLTLNSVYAVKMPDNYVVLYNLSPEREQRLILRSAEDRLLEIKDELLEGKEMGIRLENKDYNATRMMGLMYKNGRKTKKFYTDSSCVGCGICVTRCPDKAIQLVDGKPKWVKDHCTHCMACMRCNAIQYGKRTQGRERYVHPIMKQKKLEKKTH